MESEHLLVPLWLVLVIATSILGATMVANAFYYGRERRIVIVLLCWAIDILMIALACSWGWL